MRFLIAYNKAAGTPRDALFSFERALAQDGDECVLRVSDGTTRVERLLDDASEFDAVIVAGGDGTASSCLYRLRGTGVPVLHFPSGTSNLLTTNLGNPTAPAALARVVREGVTLDFDLGELALEDGTGTAAPRLVGFDMMAGAGFDATIMEQAAPLKKTLGSAAYLACAVANPSPKVSTFSLELDGRQVVTRGICVLLVNFGKISESVAITPDNDPRDGLFDVVVLKARQTVMLLPAVIAAFLGHEGDFLEHSDVAEVYKAREVHVRADPPLTIQYDGEPCGITTPFSAHVLPGAARLLVDREVAARMGQRLPASREAS